MQRVAILGWPVGHSISPQMHNAAFAAGGIPARYEAWPVPPEQLAAAVKQLCTPEWVGANVTIPHKETVVPLLDELDPMAALVGAVNTIARRGDRLHGYNTDWIGFLTHLRDAGCDPAGQRAVILGAGGAARAVAVALAHGGVTGLAVLNRTPSRAEGVAQAAAETARRAGRSLAAHPGPLEGPEAREILSQAGLVINCTPLGMAPAVDGSPLAGSLEALPPTAVVYDTVYRPAETRLLREARSRGLQTVGGLGMLVYQGALAWEHWFGAAGPVDLMFQAAETALNG